ALRSEAPILGAEADKTAIRLDVEVTDVVYRGTNVEHLLRLPDGQRLLVTATRRQAEPGARVRLGVEVKDLVPLEAARLSPPARPPCRASCCGAERRHRLPCAGPLRG